MGLRVGAGSCPLDHPHLNRNLWKLQCWVIALDSRRIVAFDHTLRHLVRRNRLKELVGECVSGGVALPG